MGPRVFLLLLLLFDLICLRSYPHAQSEAIGDVLVDHVEFRDGEIRGVLTNKAAHRVRDVELVVRYFWVWKAKNRGRAKGPERPFRYTVRQEIPPRGSIPFSYATPPLPNRDDGYYDIEVKVARSVNVDSLSSPDVTRGSGKGPDLKTPQDVARIVGIERLMVRGPVVSGVVRNKAPHRIRDVELLVRYVWVPDNEYQPGQDDLGKATYYTIRGEIQPGGSIPFSYDSSPLASRSDGQFQTKVKVAGFVEVDPRKAEQDRDAPRIRLGKLARTSQRGEAAARLEATVDDPSGIRAVELWLNGQKATRAELKVDAGDRESVQLTRTFALPRIGHNCVAVAATDTRGNSSISKEVCLYRESETSRRQPRVAPLIPERGSDSRSITAPQTLGTDTSLKPDAVGPRIELLRPRQQENIGVGTVWFKAALDDESGIAKADVWLNDQKLPSSGAGNEPRGQKRVIIERTVQVTRTGINCFGLNARDVTGNTSRDRVCLETGRQPVPGQASAEVRSMPTVPQAKAAPPVSAPPVVRPARSKQVTAPAPNPPPDGTIPMVNPKSVMASEQGPLISMEKKIEVLKGHYLAERITAQQFDRAVRTLESGKRNRLLEDFINGQISVSTFRRVF